MGMISRKIYTYIFLLLFSSLFFVGDAHAMQVKTITYTGNGADSRSITGCGFQPDVVIVKRQTFNNTKGAIIRTASMTGDNAKDLNATSTFTANLIQGLEADGFQVGTDEGVNENSAVYHAVCFKAHSNDLKESTYTGNGADSRSITGVGFQPTLVIVFTSSSDNSSAYPVYRQPGNSGDLTSTFSSGNGGANMIQALETDGFQVGTNERVNANTITYYYVALKDASGIFKTSTYTGNGADDRSITGVGFQPDNVWVQDSSGPENLGAWKPSTLAGDSSLQWTNGGAAANFIQALQSDGFQIGTDGQVNADTQTYGYMAWKDGNSISTAGTSAFAISSIRVEDMTSTSATVKWYTPSATNNTRLAGEPIPAAYRQTSELKTQHEALLTNLSPETIYYYTIYAGLPGMGFHTTGSVSFRTLSKETGQAPILPVGEGAEEIEVLHQEIQRLQLVIIQFSKQLVEMLKERIAGLRVL